MPVEQTLARAPVVTHLGARPARSRHRTVNRVGRRRHTAGMPLRGEYCERALRCDIRARRLIPFLPTFATTRENRQPLV